MKRISEDQFKEDLKAMKDNLCPSSVKALVRGYIEALREAYKEIDLLKNPKVAKESLIEILDHFNATCDKQSQHIPYNYDPIRKILRNGISVQNCKDVISLKYSEWADEPEMEKYLSIHTIFARKNFFKYLDCFQNLSKQEQCNVRCQQASDLVMKNL